MKVDENNYHKIKNCYFYRQKAELAQGV